jgi:hypothetical protein
MLDTIRILPPVFVAGIRAASRFTAAVPTCIDFAFALSKAGLSSLRHDRCMEMAAGKIVRTKTKLSVTQIAMDRPKMRSAGIFDARLLANEHAEVVVVTNIAAPVF